MPVDAIKRENIRMCIQLNLFHKLERNDIEVEVMRLNEKLDRYLRCTNEHTERVQARIAHIKTFL